MQPDGRPVVRGSDQVFPSLGHKMTCDEAVKVLTSPPGKYKEPLGSHAFIHVDHCACEVCTGYRNTHLTSSE